jgi:hypothetical protein
MAQTQTDSERKRANRERTALCRARKKERAAAETIADEERRFEEFNQWRVRERLVFPGEIEAFENAENCVDAVRVSREFLLALGQLDTQAGECLLDIERRVCFAWAKAGAPLLNRNTIRLDTSVADTTGIYLYDFNQKWVPLEGADLPIDISTLPVIVVPELVEVPAVDTPVIVEVAPTIEDTVAPTLEEQLAMEHRRQKGLCPVAPREALLLKTQQDAMDEKSRKLSQANEARELALEKRLGTYAYEAEKRF